ncbi:MAG: hypothetical protein HQ567_14770 [Candidatus Nealsonbacteria bacterium]|nr:hypothetical protein [Candidatus Nealsonbacteria bacterium]
MTKVLAIGEIPDAVATLTPNVGLTLDPTMAPNTTRLLSMDPTFSVVPHVAELLYAPATALLPRETRSSVVSIVREVSPAFHEITKMKNCSLKALVKKSPVK